MKKIFTLATAILASFSLWAAEETFTFEWTAAGTKGCSYSQAGPASGEMLTNNALYFVSNEGPKAEGSNLNPYRVGFIFKPAVDVTLKIKGAAGSSDRTLQGVKIDKDIDARFYDLCKDAVGSDKTVMQYALDNASDEDKEFYTTVGILKKSSGQYVVAGDAKSVSGQTAQAKLYAERVDANNIKFPKNGEAEETLMIGSPASNFTFEAGKYYRIYTEVSSSTGAKLLSFTFVTVVPACNKPEKELVLKADKEAPIYVGDEVTFSTEGGNSNTPVIAGDAGEEINAGKWIATEGKHTFTATQEAEGEICAQVAVLELTVLTKNPVTAVTIAGEKEGFIGEPYTYTATAANATDYAWYVDGVSANTNAAEFTYTPNAAGTYSIVCKARNEYNAADEWIASDPIELKVTKKVVVMEDTYIWKKGSGYTGCVENPNVDANANNAETELAYSKATFTGVTKMSRADADNTEISLTFTAKEGMYIKSICTYGKLEEPEGAQIAWDGKNWENLAAYSEGEKSFEAPAETFPETFTIKFIGVSKDSGGLWWRNALVTLGEKESPTAIENTEASVKAVKVIRDGQLYIMHNGRMYNVQGAVVK